jgi:hypothetical protein
MVQRWKTALGSYDFVLKHISGVRNIVADYLSRLVKNHLLDELKDQAEPENKQELILSLLHHDMKLPDEAYRKISTVHNSVAGHGGVEITMERLHKTYEPWTYMRIHVRHFIQMCPICQKMSTLKHSILSQPFTLAAYAAMVRLSIDFISPINTDTDTGYILVILDCFSKWVELYA